MHGSSSSDAKLKPVSNTRPSPAPTVPYKCTARISTMDPYYATKGKQLGRGKIAKKLQPRTEPMKITATRRRKRQPRPRWTSSEESSDESSEDDPEDLFGERSLAKGEIDESDEEERGDQNRRSDDDADTDTFGSSSDEAEDFIATDDGDDSNF